MHLLSEKPCSDLSGFTPYPYVRTERDRQVNSEEQIHTHIKPYIQSRKVKHEGKKQKDKNKEDVETKKRTKNQRNANKVRKTGTTERRVCNKKEQRKGKKNSGGSLQHLKGYFKGI